MRKKVIAAALLAGLFVSINPVAAVANPLVLTAGDSVTSVNMTIISNALTGTVLTEISSASIINSNCGNVVGATSTTFNLSDAAGSGAGSGPSAQDIAAAFAAAEAARNK